MKRDAARPRPLTEQGRWAEAGGIGAVGAAAMFTVSAGALTIGARVMARLPLVPQLGVRQRPGLPVRAVYPDRVHLDTTPESERGGYLALRQSGGAVHVRLGPADGRPTPTTGPSLTWTDRKRTRLNSSHVSTSYAVSCSNPARPLLVVRGPRHRPPAPAPFPYTTLFRSASRCVLSIPTVSISTPRPSPSGAATWRCGSPAARST